MRRRDIKGRTLNAKTLLESCVDLKSKEGRRNESAYSVGKADPEEQRCNAIGD